jgi:hypothetical protein
LSLPEGVPSDSLIRILSAVVDLVVQSGVEVASPGFHGDDVVNKR